MFGKITPSFDVVILPYNSPFMKFAIRPKNNPIGAQIDKISDMYFKGTVQMKEYDPESPTFAISQKIVSGLLYVIQQTYEEQFKNFKVITKEGTDKYSVTFKITKN